VSAPTELGKRVPQVGHVTAILCDVSSHVTPGRLFRIGELDVNGSNAKHRHDDRLFFTPWHAIVVECAR